MFRQRVRSNRFMVKMMHRFIIHAHQLCQAGRLLGERCNWNGAADARGVKTKHSANRSNLRHDNPPGWDTNRENRERRIRKTRWKLANPVPAFIQPDDGMIQISKQRTVLRLPPGRRDKRNFRKKQSDGRFVGIVGKRGERIKRLRLLHLIYSGIRTEIGFKFHQCQRLEEYRLHRRLARTGYGHHEGSPASHLRIDVCNERCILIFQGMQHNSQCFPVTFPISLSGFNLITKLQKNARKKRNKRRRIKKPR